ncbi:MAG: 3-phosphoshikimate 1-carboxyvinyltransferase [Oscillibacter sp.]|nr:3-phosphoshikimate 1-carboxyvinyltransferase [Oscillibacter sp.]
MNVRINPRRLSGPVTPPPSKSLAHRLVIAAALAAGTSTLRNVERSQDIEATLRCVEKFGCTWEEPEPGTLRIHGIWTREREPEPLPFFDCGESGSTLRFLIPIALALTGGGRFTGHGRLMERPQEPYFQVFDKLGIVHRLEDGVLTVEGQLRPGEYRLPGNVSSQFFTGLLFALPLLESPSAVISTTELESAAYVTMTMGVLDQAFVPVKFSREKNAFLVSHALYQCFDAAVEADWSQAAFWYAAAALGNNLKLKGLNPYSAQGDAVITRYYRKLTQPGDVTINLANCPDLLPPMAVMACLRRGTTRFIGGARLRLKESDRLSTVHQMLKAIGGASAEETAGLTVYGVSHLPGGTVDGANDHRIVMAAAVAATRCEGSVLIRDAGAVKKSYPGFWREYERLGGDVRVL